ncbi:dTMP kinase [Chamaesiphon sp.]|uniref:dTMP kinase n=1 Tax=Chamaesiphon sp. TaxID=2814140 RepID=UPI0035939331
MFFAFEGINGCGKSTQVDAIYAQLWELGYQVAKAKEPSTLGDRIRDLLIEKNNISDKTRLLLFEADRAENLDKNIRPALAESKIVLCDRYTASTIAYQRYGNNLDASLIDSLNEIATDNLQPDLMFWIDTPLKVCRKRNEQRDDKSTRHIYDESFLSRVRFGYSQIAKEFPSKMIRIDGNQSVPQVSTRILSAIKSYMIVSKSRNSISDHF